MERLLITQIRARQDGRIELFARGHRYADTILFDASDLAEVGIDYVSLAPGVMVPCRFWAHVEESDKTKTSGNPYLDVQMLERIDTPATTTSTDTSALLDELRAIRALLESIAGSLTPGHQPPAAPDPTPTPAPAQPDEWPDLPTAAHVDEALDPHVARQSFYALAGPAISKNRITAQQINTLISTHANGAGWARALAELEVILQ